ncbi:MULTISPECIES: hypothetical protein [Pseudomonas]|uniref:Uncharacterized protein n=1 Tax=Pseudomonas putida TaxID=303 RepID=A0A1L7NN33_PSEPU|nr:MULTISPECIES: hypothetical protein [Pseudomonas]BAW26888.1 Uncharacterized protein KF715C_pA3830 [Pseudomonas putida]
MTVNWELYDSKLGKLKDVELARLIGSTPHRIRRRREQLGIAPWSVGQKIEPYKHLLGYTTDRAIAAQCGVSSKSVKAYRESLGILPVFRPVPRKQALPLNHDLRPYKPLFGFVSDQEIAQLAGADLAVVQDIREALGFEPVPPVPGSSTPQLIADYHGPLLGYESLLSTMTPAKISRHVGVPYSIILQRCKDLGIQPFTRVSVASRYDHLLGKVPDALVARLAGVSRASIGARRQRLGIASATR